jgi:hypothetical protein
VGVAGQDDHDLCVLLSVITSDRQAYMINTWSYLGHLNRAVRTRSFVSRLVIHLSYRIQMNKNANKNVIYHSTT